MPRMTKADLLRRGIAERMNPADRAALGIKTLAESQAQCEVRSESELQRLCESELNRRGIVYHHLSPMAREKIGWPDLVFCVDGWPFAVELKTPDGKLSDGQKALLPRMADSRNGWTVRIVRTFDDFLSLINFNMSAGETV